MGAAGTNLTCCLHVTGSVVKLACSTPGICAKQRHPSTHTQNTAATLHTLSMPLPLLLCPALLPAGTYIFDLNERQMVDATRAGNIAHLINHSCAPNCHSRAITVRNPAGQLEDHVIIMASRDVAASEFVWTEAGGGWLSLCRPVATHCLSLAVCVGCLQCSVLLCNPARPASQIVVAKGSRYAACTAADIH